jgi:hypothetical protein
MKNNTSFILLIIGVVAFFYFKKNNFDFRKSFNMHCTQEKPIWDEKNQMCFSKKTDLAWTDETIKNKRLNIDRPEILKEVKKTAEKYVEFINRDLNKVSGELLKLKNRCEEDPDRHWIAFLEACTTNHESWAVFEKILQKKNGQELINEFGKKVMAKFCQHYYGEVHCMSNLAGDAGFENCKGNIGLVYSPLFKMCIDRNSYETFFYKAITCYTMTIGSDECIVELDKMALIYKNK